MSTDEEKEIRALQLAYGERFDARDAEGFAALYTADAEIEQHDGRTFSGTEKLLKAVRNMPPRGEGFHRIGASVIVVSGDAAHARCEFLSRSADGRFAEGHYDDRYVRTHDGWRISRRRVTIDRWLANVDASPSDKTEP